MIEKERLAGVYKTMVNIRNGGKITSQTWKRLLRKELRKPEAEGELGTIYRFEENHRRQDDGKLAWFSSKPITR